MGRGNNLIDVPAVIAYINATHGTTFTLLQRLAGGYQNGAYLLAGHMSHRQAVLKTNFAPRAITPVRTLYQRGYPIPELLYVGSTSDSTPYWVQAFVQGEPMATTTEAFLDALFTLNDLQADVISPTAEPPADSWSHYAYAVVFANASDWTGRLQRYSPETAHFGTTLHRLMRPYSSAVLPHTDVVHGDFNPDNILVQNDQIVGVIDCTFAGYGTRIIDLTTLLHYAYLYDDDPAVRTRLRTRIRQLAARDVAMVCAACSTLGMLAWAVAHNPVTVVRQYMRQSWEMLIDLHRPVRGYAG